MKYKIESKESAVEVYGTPNKDIKGIKIGQEMWIIARHIWGDNSRYVRYANVSGIALTSIKVRFISNDFVENNRRAKLLVSVWKFAYKNIPITEQFFPKRNDNKKINEDYESITLEAATLYKNYHEANLRKTTSNLRMLDKALNQEPSTKLLSKPKEKDKAEKLLNKMLKEDVGIINAINEILTNTLYVDEYGDLKTIGGKEKANAAIRRVIKRKFLKRYKVTK